MPAFLPWYTRIAFRLFPRATVHHLGRVMAGGVDFTALQEALKNTERVDLFALQNPTTRGFKIILDRKVSLYFYQDSDHFTYDGYEVGEYEKGDVTILDHRRGSGSREILNQVQEDTGRRTRN